MVKKLYVFIMISIMTVTGVCGCAKHTNNTTAEVITTEQETKSVSENETEASLESETTSESEETTVEATTEVETEQVTENVTEISTESATTESVTQHQTEKQTEPPTTTEVVTEAPTKAPKPTEKQTEAPTKKQEETTTSYWAMQEDAPEIAKLVIKYFNEYRVKEGTFKLTQGTKEMQAFADLRSQQLVKNFAHDYDDTLAAVKQLNYGEYWSDGWVQAFNGSTEAIHLSFSSGEIDEVARGIADSLHASPNHWFYLGNVDNKNSEYKYIAVGLTYNKGFWYCAVWIDANQHTGPVYYD